MSPAHQTEVEMLSLNKAAWRVSEHSTSRQNREHPTNRKKH